MQPKPAKLKCPKCGYLPDLKGVTCHKCGTLLQLECGECGHINSLEKSYCDHCRAQMAAPLPVVPPPAAPAQKPPALARQLEMESIQDTVAERETAPWNPVTPPRAQPGKPPAPAHSAKSDRAYSPFMADSACLKRDVPVKMPVQPPLSKLKRLTGPVIIAGMLCALLGILYLIVAPSLPRLRLMMTAKAYLADISEGRYDKAYGLLSDNSKTACSREDYIKNSTDYYSKAPAWQFKDIEVLAMDKNAATIRYKLKEGNADWKDDYISFVQEHNHWARPYIWIFFHPIDEAIKKGDYPQALFLAQKLYLTDPVDPRSSGYLCSAEFFMRLYDKSVKSCKRTIDNAATYPVGYSSEDLFWFNLYYADSLRYLQRDLVAIQEYNKMLKQPDLTPQEQCPLFLNQADSYVNTGDYDHALRGLMSSEGVCTQSPSKEDVKNRLAYMSGSALNEAVTFAKKTRFQAGQPPIGELRKAQLEVLQAKLGRKNARLLPKDEWMAVHVGGPEYRVFLRQETYLPRSRKVDIKDIYVFLINLWTQKATLEKSPQQESDGQ